MNKINNVRSTPKNFRRQLLVTVSSAALLASLYGAEAADDAGRPEVWIDLGGQLNRLDDGQEIFAPSLMAARPSILAPSQKFEQMPLYSIDEYGDVSFQPEASDWIFSASIRYGRSATKRHVHQQTNPEIVHLNGYTKYPSGAKFADTLIQNSEHHFILDFQAGKDVGLGVFGSRDGSSVLNVGVRFAQFSSKSNIALKSDPDWRFNYINLVNYGIELVDGGIFHSNDAAIQAARNFHGVGPSISWNASAPLAGNPQSSELALDWGLNAALLFGKQRAKVHHQTTARYHPAKYATGHRYTIGTPVNTNHTRSRSVTVPNIGGFAGLSFRYADAKVSVGYRADFFFNAIDGGIDTRKSENRGFYGPYASISIGIGN